MCFSVAWFVQFLIILVVLAFVVGMLRLWVFPMVATNLDSRVVTTINWIIWVVCAIALIYFLAELVMCALGGGYGYRPILRQVLTALALIGGILVIIVALVIWLLFSRGSPL